MPTSCVICGNTDKRVIFEEFDIDVFACKKCGHVFSSYNIDPNYNDYFNNKLINSKEQFWWDEAHKAMYNDFCQRFIQNKKGKLLDVGCGLGYFLKTVSAYPSWEVFGCEISPQAVNFAKEKLGLNNIFCGSIQDSDFNKNSFDIITLWDVIEHIPEPDSFLKHIFTLLKKTGMLFIHTPNINIQLPKARLKKNLKGMNHDIHYLEAKDHINIYSMETISRILYRNDFKQIRFIHLKPIQSVSGSKSPVLKFIKNLWYYFSVVLFWLTFKRINFDNLFVVAKMEK